ncbi:2-hydroxyacid dehydrogenase [Microbacterium sp. X-17]|uniref:2-hydroxyacid dehydrogenase n=1 Tax=Microbacterium sp. X-17 TaxID=3144404 RepID=UPI0031F55A86
MAARLVVTAPSRLGDELTGLPSGVELLEWDLDGPAPRPRLDIVVLPYLRASGMLANLASVQIRLAQSQSIGYEGVERSLPSGIPFANASSVHETSTAELALTLVLAAQRELPRFLDAAREGRWKTGFTRSLADSRVLLIGHGGVGRAIAARLAPFEVDLTIVASRARFEGGTLVHGVDELPELLPRADVVVLALPGGDATRHVLDDAALTALPEGALVVNVGRGSAVDTDALVEHVRRGRIRAALDVVDPEPLPAGHPLWSLPGVIQLPHVGGASAAMTPRIARLVREQINRMLAGRPPLNLVLGPGA